MVLASGLRGLLQVLERLLDGAREGPDLVLDRADRLAEQRPGLAQRRARAPGPPGSAAATPGRAGARTGRRSRARCGSRAASRAARWSVARIEASWRRTTPSTSLEERTNPASWVSRWPSSWLTRPKFVITRADVLAPLGERAVDLGEVAGRRLEALQAGRELGPVVAAVPAGRLEQELQDRSGCRRRARRGSGRAGRSAAVWASGIVDPSLTVARRRCPGRPRSSCPAGRCAAAAAAWRRGGSAARTCCRPPSSRRRGRSRGRRRTRCRP